MKRKLCVGLVLGVFAQLALADGLNECLTNCQVAYKQCMEDRNAIEQCQLQQKNCEQACRAH